MRRCGIELVLPLGEGRARIVADALSPEAGGIGGDVPRTRAEVLPRGADLLLRIEADEASSLRAAVNSYLRWTKAALDSLVTDPTDDPHGR